MNLEDFQRLLQEHKDKIEYARLNFEGAPPSQQTSSTSHRRSFVHRARDEIQSIYGYIGIEHHLNKQILFLTLYCRDVIKT